MFYQEYESWLLNCKGISKKAAHDYSSRIRRVVKILVIDEVDKNTIGELEKSESFKVLSVSVKSQLRRALKLYTEFLISK